MVQWTEMQQAVLDDPHPFRVVVAPRRSGKTTLALHVAAAAAQAGAPAYYLAPNGSMLNATIRAQSSISGARPVLTTPSSFSIHALRGTTRPTLVFDDVDAMRQRIGHCLVGDWLAAFMQVGARVLFIGTPATDPITRRTPAALQPLRWLSKRSLIGDGQWATHRWGGDAVQASPDQVQEARQWLRPTVFAQELLGQFTFHGSTCR